MHWRSASAAYLPFKPCRAPSWALAAVTEYGLLRPSGHLADISTVPLRAKGLIGLRMGFHHCSMTVFRQNSDCPPVLQGCTLSASASRV
jgi:hypothetical protein